MYQIWITKSIQFDCTSEISNTEEIYQNFTNGPLFQTFTNLKLNLRKIFAIRRIIIIETVQAGDGKIITRLSSISLKTRGDFRERRETEEG